MKSVSVRDLSITLGEGARAARILKSISFDVAAGTCFGLVGESGSGKSSILRCVSLLMKHWTGTVRIDGRDVREIPERERCRLVQMVFQDPYGSLHPRQSIRTVLAEPLRIHGIGERESRMERAITEVGLPADFLERYPHELSGGQRQRVAIARALILEPSVLLLDEPTSALDVSVQAEVLNLLADLKQKRGLTYLLVSHDLAVIDHMCDRLAVMQHGEIVEILDRDMLANNGAREAYSRELIAASLEYDQVA